MSNQHIVTVSVRRYTAGHPDPAILYGVRISPRSGPSSGPTPPSGPPAPPAGRRPARRNAPAAPCAEPAEADAQGLAQQIGLAPGADDQAGLRRQNFARKVTVDGEEELVAERLVFGPFSVRQVIPQSRLHLDADKYAAGLQCQDIRAPSVRQPDFVQRRPPQPQAQPGRRSSNQERPFREADACTPMQSRQLSSCRSPSPA